ncbi:hypothetical protein Bbelb_334140 [Branchiostoma belcheri]|nr:hypothetical protein Bbelb_334140 [Branchiostoma belcheri]
MVLRDGEMTWEKARNGTTAVDQLSKDELQTCMDAWSLLTVACQSTTRGVVRTFHADMSPKAEDDILQGFREGRIRIIVTIVVFGMYSPLNLSGLRATGAALDCPALKPVSTVGTRWIGHTERAPSVVDKSFLAIITHLEQVAQGTGESKDKAGQEMEEEGGDDGICITTDARHAHRKNSYRSDILALGYKPQRKMTEASSAYEKLNKEQMERNCHVLAEVKKLRLAAGLKESDGISESEVGYNNPPKGRVCEGRRRKGLPKGPGSHDGCTQTFDRNLKMGNSEGKMAKKNAEAVIQSSGLPIEDLCSDNDGGKNTKDTRRQASHYVGNYIADTCSNALHKAHKRHPDNDETFFEKLKQLRSTLVDCLAGEHSRCTSDFACPANSPDDRPSPDLPNAVYRQRKLRTTKSFHIRVLKAAPKAMNFELNYTGRVHTSGLADSVGPISTISSPRKRSLVETTATLRDGLVTLCTPLRLLDGPPAIVRCDPGFQALVQDSWLANNHIQVDLGQHKNVNKNPVAERAIEEVREELRKADPFGQQVSSAQLAVITAQLNAKVRSNGLSSREFLFQRDQFCGKQIPISDKLLLEDQNKRRIDNHTPSARSKVRTTKAKVTPSISVHTPNTYYAELPPATPNPTAGPEDATSVAILQLLDSAVLQRYQPLSVEADGNCFYRAISRVLYGHELAHPFLRLLTTMEIAEHRSFYDREAEDAIDLIEDKTLRDEDCRPPACCTCAAWYASFHYMLAMSSVLGTPFESYCPPTEHEHAFSAPLTRDAGAVTQHIPDTAPVADDAQNTAPVADDAPVDTSPQNTAPVADDAPVDTSPQNTAPVADDAPVDTSPQTTAPVADDAPVDTAPQNTAPVADDAPMDTAPQAKCQSSRKTRSTMW